MFAETAYHFKERSEEGSFVKVYKFDRDGRFKYKRDLQPIRGFGIWALQHLRTARSFFTAREALFQASPWLRGKVRRYVREEILRERDAELSISEWAGFVEAKPNVGSTYTHFDGQEVKTKALRAAAVVLMDKDAQEEARSWNA